VNGDQQYPGIKGRAARDLKQDLAVIDLVIELLDARAPSSSQNPQILRLTAGKQRLTLLHKADRSDPRVTSRWISYFKGQGYPALAFSIFWPHSRRALFRYLQGCKRELSPAFGRRPLRVMVVGIPNVGKSSFINYLVKRRAARTGNRPGITRGRQWIRLLPGVELLDTPGILYPRISKKVALPLSAVGAIPAGSQESLDTAKWLIKLYRESGKEEQLLERYRELTVDVETDLQLEQIGVSQGCLLTGGKIDLQRAAETVLRDFQNGSLGRLSLEHPPG